MDDLQDRINVPNDSIDDSTLISTKLIPTKLVCFFKDEQGETYAIIQSCLQQSKNMSVLTYQWKLEYEGLKISSKVSNPYDDTDDSSTYKPIYHKVSVDTIQKIYWQYRITKK